MKKSLLFFLQIALLLTVLTSCSSDNDADIPSENSESSVEETILSLVNEHRRSLSLEILKENATAKQLAVNHAQFMANQEELSIDGNAERKAQLQNTESATAVIELNSRFYSPEELVQNWLTQGSQTKNTLESNYSDVGIAAVKDKNGNNYYTLIMFRAR